jgi:hypothetical protein
MNDGGGCDAGFAGSDTSLLLGYLLCGSNDLTKESPFLSATLLKDGNDYGVNAPFYSFGEWRRISPSWVSGCQGLEGAIRRSTDEPLWAALQAMTNDCRILVFPMIVNNVGTQLSHYSIAVKDNADRIVDSLPFITSRTPSCGSFLAASPTSDISVGVASGPASGTIDCATTYDYMISNSGPGAAYGVTFSMPVPDGMQAQSVTGSQGQGAISNNTVKFDIGPLAGGSKAKVKVSMVPLRTGFAIGSVQATVEPGEGLTDPQKRNNTTMAPSIAVSPPVLSVVTSTDYAEVSWISATGQLVPQSASRLDGVAPWKRVSNGIVSDGERKTLRVPFSDSARFFRLQSGAE